MKVWVAQNIVQSYEDSLFNLMNVAVNIVETSGVPKEDYSIEFMKKDSYGVYGENIFKPASVNSQKNFLEIVSNLGEELQTEKYQLFSIEVKAIRMIAQFHPNIIPLTGSYQRLGPLLLSRNLSQQEFNR